MKAEELIGAVAREYLRAQLSGNQGLGTARYILDSLTPEQTSAVIRAILDDPALVAQIDLKVPAAFVAGCGLPDWVLTRERATFYRNADCDKPARLLVNVGDDEEQSLKELIQVGVAQLREVPDLWVKVAGDGLDLPEEHRKWWARALSGLQDLQILSLERMADYVLQTRESMLMEGHPLIRALGMHLPALQMPRDSFYFEGLPERVRTHASKWKQRFERAAAQRSCYLSKYTPAQVVLTSDELSRAFEQVRDRLPQSCHSAIEAYIQAPVGWNGAAAQLAAFEWEDIAPLFVGLKRAQFNLGEATSQFYDDRDPSLLDDDERDYLRRLMSRKLTEANEEDEVFYEAHRQELKEDFKLKSYWDRFVFGTPWEGDDFLAGLALSMDALFSQQAPCTRRRLTIRCDRATKRDLQDLNVEAGLYFAHRYRGLQGLLGPSVHWAVGELFNFPSLVEQWRERGITRNRSMGRTALQLKFQLQLEVELATGGTDTYYAQFFWTYAPQSVASQLVSDWERLKDHPLVFCQADRKTSGSKGHLQSVDLSDVRTFAPIANKESGAFVSGYRRANDIALRWLDNLAHAESEGLISTASAKQLRADFDVFRARYGSAIRGFASDGLGNPDMIGQLQAYAVVLERLCREARGDRNRDLLLRPVLQIGTIPVDGGGPMAVVAPWHPLRLAAIAQKARLVAGLIKSLLAGESVQFGDARLFFKDIERELAHPFYPEVVVGWDRNSPVLLSASDVVADYTLHEPPEASDDGLGDTNENPTEAAGQVLDIVRRYLALYPHEQANLSVVLYNCDSARLPQAVVDKIGAIYEDEDDVRCQVILRHGDERQLANLYERILESSDSDPDSFNASEATQDFMARLRISIMADQAPPPNPQDGCFADIAFSQDVIARHAKLEWYKEDAEPIALDRWIPPRWSRRRPAAKDDMKSVVYLCCPVQSAEGWWYLTALASLFKGDWDNVETPRLLPARQLDFQDPKMAEMLEETHNLANWVVNYDELLDRRQLLNQHVQVIRHRQSRTEGRNVIISSTAPMGLLRTMVQSRIRNLNLGISDQEENALVDRFIRDANDISGDIALRAAKNGRNASELMGIVLSRFLIQHELGVDRYFGWYFLDDYASWLGQREQQIADILVLSPELVDGGRPRLALVVSEAKYIDASSLAGKRRESQKQLRDTMQRINEALFGDPERLDRDLWLARLSDLVLDGIQFPASAGLNLSQWRRAIREGACDVYVRGYSHVFVSGPSDAADSSDFVQVGSVENAYQEVYGRPALRRLVQRYLRNESPLEVREEIAGGAIWTPANYRHPSGTTATPLVDSEGGRAQRSGTEDDEGGAGGLPAVPERPSPMPTPGLSGASGLRRHGANESEDATPSADAHADARWAYPGVNGLLASSTDSQQSEVQELAWLHDVESRMRTALQQFQMRSKLLNSSLTPNAALLRFAGSGDLTVELLNKRRSQFLTTYGLNIISIQPEAGAVVIGLERPQRQVIRLQDLWRRWSPDCTQGNQELLIAVRESNGELLFLSPGARHAPHTLIAGSTGSGKSVLLQNIVLAIAATNTPDQTRLVLIDPKQGVDYFQFDGLPHLDGGIIDDMDSALSRLSKLITQMEERYTLFKSARTPNLKAYNQRVPPTERLPVIWLIHDEFAEWMLIDEYKQGVTSMVSRLGVKARAAGIYLVFAAQRPDANVMPMQLRANLGNRLILRVDSEGTSELALGEKGAERLLGKGHLLARLEGEPLSYAQVPLVEESFAEELVRLSEYRLS